MFDEGNIEGIITLNLLILRMLSLVSQANGKIKYTVNYTIFLKSLNAREHDYEVDHVSININFWYDTKDAVW